MGHIERVPAKGIVEKLAGVIEQWPPATRELLQALPDIDLFIVEYRFGQWIAAPRSATDFYSRFVPPCPESSMCDLCKELWASTDTHRPIGVLICGSAEEYISLPHQVRGEARRRNGKVATGSRQGVLGLTPDDVERNEQIRSVSLKLNRPSDILHLVEAANSIVFEDYGEISRLNFQTPIRRTVAGSRSATLTVSLADAKIIRTLRKHITGEIPERFFGSMWSSKSCDSSEISGILNRSHHQLFMMLSQACNSDWKAKLLVIPMDHIRKHFKDTVQVALFKSILLDSAWKQVRQTHGAQLRLTAMYSALYPFAPTKREGVKDKRKIAIPRRLRPDTYVDQTLHHLLNIMRGDGIAFAPLGSDGDAGPFHDIQEFLSSLGLARLGMEFPSVLTPARLKGAHKVPAVYYSFQNPTLLAPMERGRSPIEIMRSIRERLRVLDQNSPELLNNVTWNFFQGQGVQRDKEIPQFRTRRAVVPSISQDFSAQIATAEELWDVRTPEEFFHGGKDGFMSKFIRLAPFEE